MLTGTDAVTRDVEVHHSQQLIHVCPRSFCRAIVREGPHIITSNGTWPDRQRPATFFRSVSETVAGIAPNGTTEPVNL
ncbi:hypothetical protein ID871_00275 [Streptomyces pratensis]|nr:hypothetical protein [Streptomyces pratensis]